MPGTHPKLDGLCSPDTHSPLRRDGDRLLSADGAASFEIYADGTIDLLGRRQRQQLTDKRDAVDRIKAVIKRFTGRHFNLIKAIISPVMPNIHWQKGEMHRTRLVREYILPADLALNIGSGNNRIDDHIVNLDIFDYPGVDVIADCQRLPYADQSVDAAMSMAVLEHVPDPESLVAEAARVLKPGGMLLTGVPFMEGFHASPDDFYRWTKRGLIEMHARHGITPVEIVPLGGPTSSLLWVTIEWLAMVVSFNIRPLYLAAFILFSALLFPLKLLDLLLVHHSESDKINTFYMFVGKKDDGSTPDPADAETTPP